jgi:hypothetical protein
VEALERLKAAGATGAAVTEETLRGVLAAGEVGPAASGPEALTPMGLPTATLTGPPEVMSRVNRTLVERLGLGKRVAQATATGSTMRVSIYGVPMREVVELGIGYPRQEPQEIRQAGLEVVARPRAEGNQWAAASEAALKVAQETGARLFIFSGNAALGYPDNLAGVAETIAQDNLLYGYVEFGKQYGDAGLAARLQGRSLRVHSINDTEMLGMSVARAIDRFVLGVRERNIRVCYVRLFAASGKAPVPSAEDYLRKLCDDLKGHGFRLGAPEPLQAQSLAAPMRWLAGLGALAAVALCLIQLLGSRPAPTMLGLAAVILLASLGMVVALNATMKLCALLAALALPTFAVGHFLSPPASIAQRGRALGRGLLLFLSASGLSVIGGLLVVGCLADTRFLLKLDQFAGVKLAHIVPLLGVLVIQMGWDLGSRGAETGERRIVTLLRGWREAAVAVIRYWHAVLFLVCAAAVVLMVVRSGNEAGASVSGAELMFRSLLNRVFGVRPRTKEVFIGHPLLILALARMAGGKNTGRWLLLALGTIGQESIVNTFTHLHTPLVVSVERTVHGLWTGGLIGIALYWVVEWVETLRPSLPPPSPGQRGNGAEGA